jgi:hypothetical protein
VRVDGDTARGVFDVNGDVLRAGVSRVSLLSGATLIDANAGGRPLPLVAEGNAHSALIPGPGPFSLTLEWGTPLIFGPGRASFVLPVPQAGSARATIDLPGEQADVHLSAGLVTARSVANGRTVVDVTLDPGSATEVSWSMRDSAVIAAARDTRTVADVLTLVTLGDSDTRMVALVDLTVVQGEPRTAEMRLPSGYQLTGITGSSLESSEPADGKVVLTLSMDELRIQNTLPCEVPPRLAVHTMEPVPDSKDFFLFDIEQQLTEGVGARVGFVYLGVSNQTGTFQPLRPAGALNQISAGLRRHDAPSISSCLHSGSDTPVPRAAPASVSVRWWTPQ